MSKISENKKKSAVILFNLGGPDSLDAVKPFLFNLFNDKYIITLPSFLRYFIAKIISSRRTNTAKEIYQHMGGKSTILDETMRQADALKKALMYDADNEYEIFISMRHWHPMAKDVIKKIAQFSPDEIILLPLYPQLSTTTTISFLDHFQDLKKKSPIKNIPCKTICCYPTESNFINSHIKLLKNAIFEIKENGDNYRVLFSAHGLPKKIIANGDSYQYQVEASVERIINGLRANDLDYKITYQSRVGPLSWLEPNTEDEIELAGKEGVNLVIVPISFVSEHSETLVELDIEYKEIAHAYGIIYKRVPTLSIDDLFIKSLTQMVLNTKDKEGSFITSSEFEKICSKDFSKCICNFEIK
jgi:ferrochelatase